MEVTNPMIQQSIEDFVTQSEDSYSIPLDENFGVVHIKMPSSSIRTTKFHICFMLDCSGSMNQELNNVKDTLYRILSYIKTQSTNIYISVAYFNNYVKYIIKNAPISDETIATVKRRSKRVYANNVTNIEKAFKSLSEVYDSTAENIHLFMTDGEPTIGYQTPHDLYTCLPKEFEHYFLGFGTHHEANTLYTLSHKTKGHYYFIDNPENSSLIYGEILHAFLYRQCSITLHSANDTIKFYDYKTNEWISTYEHGNVASESQVAIHYKFDWETTPDLLKYEIKMTNVDHTEETSEYMLCNETQTYNPSEECTPSSRNIEVEKYYYRQKVLEALYLGIQEQSFGEDSMQTVKTLFTKINKFCQTFELEEDPFMVQLKDDLSIVYKTSTRTEHMRPNAFYLARHTSQGSQQAYNVNNIDFDNVSLCNPHDLITPTSQYALNVYDPLQPLTPRGSSANPYPYNVNPGIIMDGTDIEDNELVTPDDLITNYTISRARTNAYATPHQTQVMEDLHSAS